MTREHLGVVLALEIPLICKKLMSEKQESSLYRNDKNRGSKKIRASQSN